MRQAVHIRRTQGSVKGDDLTPRCPILCTLRLLISLAQHASSMATPAQPPTPPTTSSWLPAKLWQHFLAGGCVLTPKDYSLVPDTVTYATKKQPWGDVQCCRHKPL